MGTRRGPGVGTRPAQDTQPHHLQDRPGGVGQTLVQVPTGLLRETEAQGAGPGVGDRGFLTGVDEDEGTEEGHLALRAVQGTQALGEVEDGADELVAAWRGAPVTACVPPACVPGVSPPRVPSLPRERKSSAPAYLPSKKTVRFSELKARHMRTNTTSMAPATARQRHGDGGHGGTGRHVPPSPPWVGWCPHSTSPGGMSPPQWGQGGLWRVSPPQWDPSGTHGTVTSLMGPEHPITWGHWGWGDRGSKDCGAGDGGMRWSWGWGQGDEVVLGVGTGG